MFAFFAKNRYQLSYSVIFVRKINGAIAVNVSHYQNLRHAISDTN
jgi:hypothetical protein